jgi:hypothetical protein
VEVNAGLKVGETSTTITVVAGANQLQTDDTAIPTVVDRQRTVDLPLNGRNAANLVLLSGTILTVALG